MAIEFRCVQCQKLLRTGDDTAGKQAKCPECGTVMTIPAAPPAGASLPPPPLPPGGDSPFGAAGPWAAGPAGAGGASEPGSPFAPAASAWSPGPISRGTLDFSDVLSRTWTILKPEWGICLAVVVIVWAITFGVNMVSGFIPIIGGIVGLLFQIWITIGECTFFLKKARGRDAAIEEVFQGWPYFVKILLACLLVGAIALGIVLVCVLPPALVGMLISREAAILLASVGGVIATVAVAYVMLILSQFYYLILDRNVDVIESLKMSRELMEGNKLTLFLISLVSGLAGGLLTILTCGLGMLIVGPYMALLQPVVYLIVTGQRTAEQQRHAGPSV